MTVVNVHGLKELQEKLRAIGSVMGSKIMRSSMYTATRPLLERAKVTAPRRSGALAQAMSRQFSVTSGAGVTFGSGETGSRFVVSVGPKTRNRTAVALYNLVYRLKKPRRGIFHGHFQEFGTSRGTRATHWMLRALQSTYAECTALLAQAVGKRIDRAARTGK